MARNQACSVFIGNLDEKVSEKVLYEILIQVGRVVDLYMPRDKDTNRHKGYAFAEYETEEIANYAINLFSGLVRLHNKTLKFAMSGQDKSPQYNNTPLTSQANFPLPNGPSPLSVQKLGTEGLQGNHRPQVSAEPAGRGMVSPGVYSIPPVYPQVSPNGLVNNGLSSSNYEYNRRVFGAMLNVNHSAARQPVAYPSY